jgi:ubiquinone/menaquinone biosynthesis C-methylase UbiE
VGSELDSLYRARFDDDELVKKTHIWRVLCQDFFQRYVLPDDTVLDLACGSGEFVNNIQATNRIGLDLREETQNLLQTGVRFIKSSATDLSAIDSSSIDVVFTSNFLEHLREKDDVLTVFREVKRILRPAGCFLIMGPNIRYVSGAYWDFFDHHLPLSERSVEEALLMAGYQVETSLARFLPYSTKSRLPQAPWLVKLYLKTPIAWPFLGKQFLVVARNPAT